MKHGLLQIAETLEFLHSNARLIHRSIAPEVIASLYSCSCHFEMITVLFLFFPCHYNKSIMNTVMQIDILIIYDVGPLSLELL